MIRTKYKEFLLKNWAECLMLLVIVFLGAFIAHDNYQRQLEDRAFQTWAENQPSPCRIIPYPIGINVSLSGSLHRNLPNEQFMYGVPFDAYYLSLRNGTNYLLRSNSSCLVDYLSYQNGTIRSAQPVLACGMIAPTDFPQIFDQAKQPTFAGVSNGTTYVQPSFVNITADFWIRYMIFVPTVPPNVTVTYSC